MSNPTTTMKVSSSTSKTSSSVAKTIVITIPPKPSSSEQSSRSKTSGRVPLKKRKRSQESSKKIAKPLSPKNTTQCVVSDDDSVSRPSGHPKNGSVPKRQKVSTKKVIQPIQPLEPMPLKLNKSEIHSKKYPFPQKLFDLLEKSSLDDRASKVVSWSPDGKTFVVHDHARFAAEFLPTYFGHTQLRSFDRQLNYWGYELVSPREINNTTFGGKSWKHPSFQKDRRDLLKLMTRKMTKKASSSPKSTSLTKKTTKRKSRSLTYPATKKAGQTTSKGIRKPTKSDIETATAGIAALPMDLRLRTRLRLRKPKKGVSVEPGLSSRIVSPVHGNSCPQISNCNLRAVLTSALGVVEGNCDDSDGQLPVSTNLEDEFLPLFPLESLGDHCNAKSTPRATDVAPFIDSKTVMNGYIGSTPESYRHADAFGGNGFHDVDFTMDLGIDMDVDMKMDTIVDETELFLNIIQDGDGNNAEDSRLQPCETVHDEHNQKTSFV